jgi:hypothetical protein
MRSTFLLALGLTLLYPVTVASAGSREQTLREECTRDRCVYYKGVERQFSVERENGTKRVIIRDGDRNVVAKVQRTDDGRIKVKEPPRRRKDR